MKNTLHICELVTLRKNRNVFSYQFTARSTIAKTNNARTVASICAVVITEGVFALADYAEVVVNCQTSGIVGTFACYFQIFTRLVGWMQARMLAVAGPTVRALAFVRADLILAHCQRMARISFAFVNV